MIIWKLLLVMTDDSSDQLSSLIDNLRNVNVTQLVTSESEKRFSTTFDYKVYVH